MNTAQQLHILFDLEYQKLNRGAKLDLQEPEIDWLLNLAIRTFIKKRLSFKQNTKVEGADDSAKRVIDLENITELGYRLPVYKITNSTAFAMLPANFHFLYASGTAINCGVSQVFSADQYYVVVELDPTYNNDEIESYKIEADKGQGYSTIYEMSNVLKLYKGLEYEIVHDILSTMITNYSVYWQMYNGTFYNNSFIITSDVPFTLQVTSGANIISYASDTNALSIYSLGSNLVHSVDRLVGKDEFRKVMNYTYTKPTIKSVVVNHSKNLLYIAHPQNFSPCYMEIDYVKRPIFVNYFKNRGTNLGSYVQDELVGLAVELATVYDKTKNLQEILFENNNND